MEKSQFQISIILIVLFNFTIFAQDVNYSYFNTSSENLKIFLLNNDDYMSGGNSENTYFQGKYKSVYIKFYNTIGINVTFDIESTKDYLSVVHKIRENANFRFKYCSDYDEPIVYNYESVGGNRIRYNLERKRINVQFPTKLSSSLDNNVGLTTVFLCLSNQAYAYHTNLKCEGLANCDSDIAKSTIEQAKKYSYKICEICTNPE